MSGLPTTPIGSPTPAVASRGKIVMMAVIAGAVITNIYCTQPILPLIRAGFKVDLAMVDLVAAAALLGFSTGLALLLPLGDRFDRRRLVLVQIALAFVFGIAAAVSPSIWTLIAASFGLGIVSCVPQQLVPFAAVMSRPTERGRNVGTVVSGIMVGILVGRTIAGVIGATLGWRAVYGFEAAFMVPVWFGAASLLPRGVPSTNLSYGRLLASLWPLARDNRPIRESMIVQAYPKAQGRINSLYMTATFFGGAVGTIISGWLMSRFGWSGIVAFGTALGLIASAFHLIGAPRSTGAPQTPHPDAPIKASGISSTPD